MNRLSDVVLSQPRASSCKGPLSNLVVHIGYARTGTSWLQRYLFDDASGLFWNIERAKLDAISKIVSVTSFRYDPERVRGHFDSVASKLPPGRVPVLSCERLAGWANSGGFDKKLIADRLGDTFPEAKILITVREQSKIILSTYNNYLNWGGTDSLENYLSRVGSHRIPKFNLDHFRYDLLAEYYIKLFGPDRVLVLPFELFLARPNEYLDKIIRFSGLDNNIRNWSSAGEVKQSVSPCLFGFLRRLNSLRNAGASPIGIPGKYIVKFVRGMNGFMPNAMNLRSKKLLISFIKAKIGDEYLDGNKKLQHLTDVDLSEFDYYR